ncbi:hypothetical protein DYB35_009301 [Aphanomyces astaci]|uniref:Serine carboxypeptidase S28 n=1 Tax=Aphanomyces astaci TaxID=112090 RepID=A0A3R7EC29_APHAT|nr:hypothetical protein DYB35_009301 [Aphanomyces astaci]
MVRVLALASIATALASATPSLNVHQFRITDFLDEVDPVSLETTEAAVDQELWFSNQKLDHTNPSNSNVWNQRYFVNSTFYGGPGSPVFLTIEGEWTASLSTVTSGGDYFNALAKKHKALIVSLEHRFYGKSQPFANLSTANLKYLSADQALADIANFQDFFSKSQNITADSKWVAVGASYAGMLSTWLKLKYPTRFAGTWASSAPILAKEDYFEYSDHVSEGLRYFGGDQCVNRITAATTELHRLVASSKPDDVASLNKLFKPCYEFTSNDDRGVFEGQIYGAFQGPAQANDYAKKNLDFVCKAFANTTVSPIEALSAYIGNNVPDKCTYNSLQGYIQYYQNVVIAPVDTGSRQWFYQTCSEFGFGQTTSTSSGAFSPLQFGTVDVVQRKLCAAVFNITDTAARVARTNAKYGGLKVDVPNVVSVTGTIDPWDALALTNATGAVNAKTDVVEILATSHCRDYYTPRATDSGHLVWAHQRIDQAIDRYVNGHASC